MTLPHFSLLTFFSFVFIQFPNLQNKQKLNINKPAVLIPRIHSICINQTNRIYCKSLSSSYCFWHNLYGCISISESPTTHPTTNPSTSPTIEPTTAPPTFSIISTIQCGDRISGQTSFAHHIDFYALHIHTATDIFLDSCNSSFDTWLFLEDANGPMVACDDCGECGLQTQLNVNRVEAGEYFVGIGGYKEHFGEYTLHILCNRTLPPTLSPTIITTKHPTPKPLPQPNIHPTHRPTLFPSFNPTMSPTAHPIDSTHPDKHTEIPSLSPTQNPTLSTKYPSNIFNNLSVTESDEKVLNVTDSEQAMNERLIGAIVSIFVIGLVIGSWYALKCVRQHRTRKYHINVSVDDEDDGDLSLDDVDIINLIHGKRNCVNNLNVDEIVERATIDLMNLSKKESDLNLVITNGETVTKQ